ncbi:MAG: 50S ribosomal protein L25 [Patescibacteria group bacterium]|nr:50S ribosomal protein L25 [Patescibacteria group bacterium]
MSIDLQAQKREITGKKVKALKKQGLIPAELYGHKTENVHLAVAEKEFSKVFKEAGESTVVNLVFGGKKISTLIQDVSSDPIRQKFNHIDFYAVKMDKKIEANVVLEFKGESAAVKQGGVLVKSMKEIEVRAFPNDLPSYFEVDLSKLENLHQSIYVKDIKVSDKVRVLVDPGTVVATVVELEKEEAAPAVNVEDIKVEGEEKKKEKDGEPEPES